MIRKAINWVMMLFVVMLTTLSLLPHHHHECADSLICMLPYNCEHEGECAHSHDTPISENGKCGFKLIDVSAVNKGDKSPIHSLVSIILFFIPTNIIEINASFSVAELEFLRAFKTYIADYGSIVGLRAPPCVIL